MPILQHNHMRIYIYLSIHRSQFSFHPHNLHHRLFFRLRIQVHIFALLVEQKKKLMKKQQVVCTKGEEGMRFHKRHMCQQQLEFHQYNSFNPPILNILRHIQLHHQTHRHIFLFLLFCRHHMQLRILKVTQNKYIRYQLCMLSCIHQSFLDFHHHITL